MERVDAWLRHLSPGSAFALFLLENLVIFGLSLAVGAFLVRRFAHRRVTAEPPPVTRSEHVLVASTIVLNAVVTFAGWVLWQLGVVHFRTDTGLFALADVPVLLLAMDAAMYVLHRLAHHRLIFKAFHAPHHRAVLARPLTLFVLAPWEVLGFGGLWLVVISLYDASWLGMSLYLALNVAFGVIGHLGVEPAPDAWVRWPVVRAVTTTTFHAEHHLEQGTNFGFYTCLWDRLFGTLSPSYEARFARPHESPAPAISD